MTDDTTRHGESDRGTADLSALLADVAAFEAATRVTPVTLALRVVGRSRAFATVYPKVMPRIDVRLARATHGWVSSRVLGLPGLVITTRGAKSGLPRTQPLLYVRDGDDFVVLGTNFGRPKHPGWTANLRHDPRAFVEVGPGAFAVAAQQVGPDEFELLFERFATVYPGYRAYVARRGDLTPRMFRLTPVAVATPVSRPD